MPENSPSKGSPALLIVFVLFILALFAGAIYFINQEQKSNKPLPPPQKDTITIGILSLKTRSSYETSIASMKEQLAKKGYTNIQYLQDEITETTQYDQSAKKYVDMNVDVIVTNSTPAVQAAMKATTTIPIVFGSVGDPVLNGIVPNMESSGRNVTGISSLSVELTRKRLGRLKLLIPNLTKVYIVHQPGEVSSDNGRMLAMEEAELLNITLIDKPATVSADMKTLAASLKATEAQAILLSASSLVGAHIEELVAAQNREKIPVIGQDKTMIDKGTILSYGASYKEIGRQVADVVSQTLSGTKPQYIPIQRPEKLELIINKKAAENIKLRIPEDILNQADEIIQ